MNKMINIAVVGLGQVGTRTSVEVIHHGEVKIMIWALRRLMRFLA